VRNIQQSKPDQSKKTKVTLALGSGGARGYAHIGVIQELESRGYEVVGIAGTSMGAVIGALYATNTLQEYTEWVLGLKKRDIAALIDITASGPGSMKAERVMGKVNELIGGVKIEDLPIPFTALASDIVSQKEVWFQSGPLDLAIRASISIPGVITPIMVNGSLLSDGGLFNPVPTLPLASIPADMVIAVSLSGPSDTLLEEETQPAKKFDLVKTIINLMREQDAMRWVTEKFNGELTPNGHSSNNSDELNEAMNTLPPGLRTYDVVQMSILSMQNMIQRFQLAISPPDVLIEIPFDSCGMLEFHRAKEQIALGRKLAKQVLDKIAR
jgi:NTE family protein